MGSKNDDHFNGLINTSLGLGLTSFNHQDQDQDQEKEHKKIKKQLISLMEHDGDDDHLFPSLTLSLSPEDRINQVEVEKNDDQKEEVKIERVASMSMSMCSRAISDQEDEEGSPKKKLRLSKQQSATLEEKFKQQSTPNPMQKKLLAAQLNMKPRQVEVWFQNRRARTKLKQTEEYCEILKKCWQTLTEENKRLHNELKALKLTTYMQIQPPPTLNMCICCHERNGYGGATPNNDHQLFNPLTNPSAAC